ncbi:hypothetical protein [Streptomyces sp. NPDC058683]|uniref:hypothetical protein n=1 Tax=Streptomyces sp. NPDC058683 TaxID=3346597 RepID=UPI003649E071
MTTFEFFFDLVYVFALTQVTACMAHQLGWAPAAAAPWAVAALAGAVTVLAAVAAAETWRYAALPPPATLKTA